MRAHTASFAGLLRQAHEESDPRTAFSLLAQVCDQGSAADLMTAGRILDSMPHDGRRVRIAVVGSFTVDYYARLLRAVLRRCGVSATTEVYGYDQYRQQLLDSASPLYRFEPHYIVVATHHESLQLSDLADEPAQEVAGELARWRALWETARDSSPARLVHILPALPDELSFGNLSLRLPGSWYRMALEVRLGLGESAGSSVLTVDSERLAGSMGKWRWFDPVSWSRLGQPMSMEALAALARESAAVIAADLGFAKKCLVLDLDNTLWGGVIGEDGLSGIVLGGHRGEGHLRLQRHLLGLKARGMLLAVCSKNSADNARLPFLEHPDMRLRLSDISCFSAGWEPKSVQVERIAADLGIALSSLLVLDDDPVECAEIRKALPDVDVLPVPENVHEMFPLLAGYPLLERSWLTSEDRRRVGSYSARAAAKRLRSSVRDLDEFYTELKMSADLAPIDEHTLPRVAQLVVKTNQFNVTGRRRNEKELAALLGHQDTVACTVRLRDTYSDHGIVGVLIAVRSGPALSVDTWLLSCRVIGRTVERTMLRWLAEQAAARGLSELAGRYVPSPKNSEISGLYQKLGFCAVSESADGSTKWRYRLQDGLPPRNNFITEWPKNS